MKSWSASVEPTTSCRTRPKRSLHASKTAGGKASPDDTQSLSDDRSRGLASAIWRSRAYTVATAKNTVGRSASISSKIRAGSSRSGTSSEDAPTRWGK